ncbi:MAG TPA: aminopeptidase N, partial [Sutterella sp.]|nr:aminopeptidase N [Sutterella sp.]
MATHIVRRSDYTPPTHRIESVFLEFHLHPTRTCVTSSMRVAPVEGAPTTDLVLNGRELELEFIKVDGLVIREEKGQFKCEDSGDIVIAKIDRPVTIEIRNYINPQANTSLMGLYLSHGNFTTQCEAEGFRRITYFMDRPDVSTKFTVRINAPKLVCPVTLSNGNLIDEGDINEIWHYSVWE